MSVHKMATLGFVAICIFVALSGAGSAVEKIRIDPATRMYRGTRDGRVYTFHGLDTEDSSRPWYLRTLNLQQIKLMKSVSR